MTNTATIKYTSGKLLTKNVFWNFLSQAVPLLVAFFTVPFIIKALGMERFGILTLVWAIIGTSSLFDFGLGRALTQVVSKKLGEGDTKDLSTIIWTALFLIFAVGFVFSVGMFASAPIIVSKLLKIPEAYIQETVITIRLLGVCLPFLLWTVCLNGVLQSYQKFSTISAIKIPLGIVNFIAPFYVTFFTKNLAVIIGVLILARIIIFFVYFIVCSKLVENFFSNSKFEKKFVKSLLKTGSWMTVSNYIIPLMVYLDRFFVANMLNIGVIAYYTTPSDMIRRLSVVPSSITGVLFPAFSAEFANNREKVKSLYTKSIKYIFLLLLFPVLIIVFFAKPFLAMWLGAEFAQNSYKITQLMAITMLLTSLTFPSFSLVQAAGRSDIMAKLHMIQFVIFIPALLFFIKMFGLMGAAYASFVRMVIDCILQYIITRRLLNKPDADLIFQSTN